MNSVTVDILPGGMLSDVVETEMAANEHQEVVNFRLTRHGEWETVKGYADLVTGLTDLRAAIEVTEDRSGDRFLLLQCGYGLYSIKRIDYDAASGYAGQTVQSVSLPPSTTIPDLTCRFFLHSGVVRIIGPERTDTGKPITLWYGYVKKTVPDTGVDVAGWRLTFAPVKMLFSMSMSSTVISDDHESTDEKKKFYYALFFIFENGQFSVPWVLSTTYMDDLDLSDYSGYARRFTVDLTESEFSDRACRLTGAGVLVSESTWPQKLDDGSLPWHVADFVDLVEEPSKKIILCRLFNTNVSPIPIKYPSADITKRLYRHFDLDSGGSNYEANLEEFKGYVYAAALAFGGRKVDVIGAGGTVTTRIDTTMECFIGRPDPDNYTMTYSVEFYFQDDVHTAASGTNLQNYTLKFYDEPFGFTMGSARVRFPLVADLKNLPTLPYSDFSQLTAGTSGTDPAYSDFTVVDSTSYAVSEEEDESDMLRVSLPMQLDVHPKVNLMPVDAGDADCIKAVLNRDGRIVILKENSISQGQNVGGRFSADIALAKVGLFPDRGWIIIEDVLYFMDRDEVYAFTGGRPQKLLSNQRMRKVYRESVHAASFFAWNKQDRELWLILNAKILAYQLDFDAWYIRDIDLTPISAFNLFDGTLVLSSASKLVALNHNGTPDESVTASLKTRLIDLKTPEKPKKTGRVSVTGQGNSFRIAAYDPVRVDEGEDSIAYATLTADADQVKAARTRPNKLFYGAELRLDCQPAGTAANIIRRIAFEMKAFGP